MDSDKVSRSPDRAFSVQQAVQEAVRLHQRGELGGAEKLYLAALKADPNHFGCLHGLGILRMGQGRPDDAARLFRKAVRRNAKSAETHRELGHALIALNQHEQAISQYEKAIVIKPDYAQAHNDLGNALQMIERRPQAIAHYRSALSINPDFAPALLNLGNALMQLYCHSEAEMCFRHAVALLPEFAEAYVNVGSALLLQYKYDEAIAHFERALSFAPDHAVALTSLGVCLAHEGRKEEALAALRRAAALKPGFLTEWHTCMASLPVAYRSETELSESRTAYSEALTGLARNFSTNDRGTISEAPRAIGVSKPFFLPYQGECDRDLQSTYGILVARVMAARYPEYAERPETRRRSSGSRIRVGVLSGFFYHHSVWKIPMRGWMEGLSRDRFELHGYYTDVRRDACTEAARKCCVKFVDGPREVDAWASIIRADALDILVIPEIGMNPMTLKLAALRLAPLQATSWGHPSTSGLPTIDYFLSSDLMEPQNAAGHYTETLVRLPNLGIHYQPSRDTCAKVARSELGFDEADVLYWCCQFFTSIGRNTIGYLPGSQPPFRPHAFFSFATAAIS
jgi:protein O-GlcNAc transferase